jgi:hypothetical protein
MGSTDVDPLRQYDNHHIRPRHPALAGDYLLPSLHCLREPARSPSLITEVAASQCREGLPPTSRIWHGQRSTGLCGVNPVLVNKASPCVSPSAFPHRNMDHHACLRTAALEHASSVQQASQKNAMKQFSREHTTPAVGCAATSEERSPGNVSLSPRTGGGGRHNAACATHELASPARLRVVPPIHPAASGWSVFGNRRISSTDDPHLPSPDRLNSEDEPSQPILGRPVSPR